MNKKIRNFFQKGGNLPFGGVYPDNINEDIMIPFNNPYIGVSPDNINENIENPFGNTTLFAGTYPDNVSEDIGVNPLINNSGLNKELNIGKTGLQSLGNIPESVNTVIPNNSLVQTNSQLFQPQKRGFNWQDTLSFGQGIMGIAGGFKKPPTMPKPLMPVQNIKAATGMNENLKNQTVNQINRNALAAMRNNKSIDPLANQNLALGLQENVNNQIANLNVQDSQMLQEDKNRVNQEQSQYNQLKANMTNQYNQNMYNNTQSNYQAQQAAAQRNRDSFIKYFQDKQYDKQLQTANAEKANRDLQLGLNKQFADAHYQRLASDQEYRKQMGLPYTTIENGQIVVKQSPNAANSQNLYNQAQKDYIANQMNVMKEQGIFNQPVQKKSILNFFK